MPGPSGKITIVMPDELRGAVERRLSKRKTPMTVSDLVRKLIAEWLGRPSLGDVKQGRPFKDDSEA